MEKGYALGCLILLIVFLFLILLWTASCHGKKIKPRTFPDDPPTGQLTNTFETVKIVLESPINFLPQSLPTFVAPPPFTGSVMFAWSDAITNSVALIMRTENWSNWTILERVMFSEGDSFTNSVVDGQTNLLYQLDFIDLYPPNGQAYYQGLVVTNR